MRVFITGASGFIGGSVAARFMREGYSVRGLVRTPEQVERLKAQGIEPVPGTLADAGIVGAIARRLGLWPAESWPVQDAIDEWGFGHAVYSFGSNSRVSAAKARKELGWQPQHTSVLDWIKNDMKMD
ncbi:MAG: NAD(P)H-binding protein [Collimonas sp.]|uniref:NmrA family NAD(P)-binding protein n=1 Tax=Collimonas sp. TaxID=1963772 RepID=UPI003263BCA1